MKKKKILLIGSLIISTLITSCSYFNVVYKKDDVKGLTTEEILNKDEYKNEIDELLTFSSKVSSSTYDYFNDLEKNMVISPLSLYFGLALTSVLASNDSENEILNALNIDYDRLIEFVPFLYRYLYQDNERVKVLIDNSFWIQKGQKFDEEVLKILSEKFYASSYELDFLNDNKNANESLAKYIDEKTNHLLNPKLNYGIDTLFVLMNILYFKNSWLYENKALESDGIHSFKNSDGSISDVELFKGSYFEGHVYETEDYKTFYTKTLSNYTLQFIVPNDGISIDDIFDESLIKDVALINDYSSRDEEENIVYSTRVIFPEFEADFSNDLTSVFKEEFNIENIFDLYQADFSSSFKADIYIKNIYQYAKLKVDRRGIEGAAVTMMAGRPTGQEPYQKIYDEFIIDRNFIYFIKDNMNNILFSGVVNKI